MNLILKHPHWTALVAGLCAALGFAPYGGFLLPLVALALLFALWLHADTPLAAAKAGLLFGAGLFGTGVDWLYVALHDYGSLPAILSIPAAMLFAAIFALIVAGLGYAQARWRMAAPLHLLLWLPAAWTAVELLRGYLFTGVPWMVLGYAQAPAGPLAGYAPVFGVYGVSLVLAVSAGLLVAACAGWRSRHGKLAAAALLLLWLGGAALQTVEWTAARGEPFKVSLLQGNIAQEMKFDEEHFVATLEIYRRLVQSSDAPLIVLPETAMPILRRDMPETYETMLRRHALQHGGDILIGTFEKEQGRYYNSVVTLGASPSQHYHKDHLVPFGEYIPLRPVFGWLVNGLLDIPMSDLARGGEQQPLLNVAGQQVAVNICYEDVFGEEIIRALPQASVLVNVTNDAWYGSSSLAALHNHYSQMRALETGRMMLRATNTGVTSIIGRDGSIVAMLPQHEQGVLNGMVQGYAGSTPYVRWGNAAVMVLLLLMALAARYLSRRSRNRAGERA